jgi:hypothetical protein
MSQSAELPSADAGESLSRTRAADLVFFDYGLGSGGDNGDESATDKGQKELGEYLLYDLSP